MISPVWSFARNPLLAYAWMGADGQWVRFPSFEHRAAPFDTGIEHGPFYWPATPLAAQACTSRTLYEIDHHRNQTDRTLGFAPVRRPV